MQVEKRRVFSSNDCKGDVQIGIAASVDRLNAHLAAFPPVRAVSRRVDQGLRALDTAAISFVVPFDTAPRVVREIERLQLAKEHWMAVPAARGQAGALEFIAWTT